MFYMAAGKNAKKIKSDIVRYISIKNLKGVRNGSTREAGFALPEF